MRHLLDLDDLTTDEITRLLDAAADLKAARARGDYQPVLAGRVLGMIFEKPSLRTRVSFETAMAQLGGSSIFLVGKEVGLGARESIADFARVMSQYVDAVVLRVFRHQTVRDFAAQATCPVINGLSDRSHPCQALGDLLTLRECAGGVKGRTLAFVGDGNNVARSVALGCAKLGVKFILAAPKGYGFDEPFLKLLKRQAPKASITFTDDPVKAVKHADIIYTDVWTSMGQEDEREQRRRVFAPFQVNEALLAKAPPTARVMHCLPAIRGEEVTDAVLDGPQSVVFEQAGNRLHAQKALLRWLMT